MSKCGDCNICCTVMSIKELSEAGKQCIHVCKSGCSIYDNRPSACEHFKCAYLTSGWKEEYRPDKSGIMVAGFEEQISVYRLKENINMDLFNIVSTLAEKQDKKVLGYDCRKL